MIATDDLSKAELEVVEAAGLGTEVDLQAGDWDIDDPVMADAWGEERVVRAEILAELLMGRREPDSGPLRAVKLRGARIDGALDLEAATLSCPLELRECWFEQPINLSETQAKVIRLPGCHVPGINADEIEIRGDLDFNDGFTAHGEVSLIGARIGGWLDLRDAKLDNPGGTALDAQSATVGRDMFCDDEFNAKGEVCLTAARIDGYLMLGQAKLANPAGRALMADKLSVGQAMLCMECEVEGEVRIISGSISGPLDFSKAKLRNLAGDAFNANDLTAAGNVLFIEAEAEGAVALPHASIGGSLSMKDAKLRAENRCALDADRLTVTHYVDCRGVQARGTLRFTGGNIGGSLIISNASLTGGTGDALNAASLTVTHDVNCQRLQAEGAVLLSGARIDGTLHMSGAKLKNTGGYALNADYMKTGRAIVFDDGFEAEGQISLASASVSSDLIFEGAKITNPGTDALRADDLTVVGGMYCGGLSAQGRTSLTRARVGVLDLGEATLINPGEYALAARRLTVESDMYCGDSFTARGGVRLLDSRITGRLDFTGGELGKPNADIASQPEEKQGLALDLEGADASSLILLPKKVDGTVDLTNARVRSYRDEMGCWPDAISLQGFAYESLESDSVRVRDRLRWLARDRDLSPGTYDHLAAAYQRAGRTEAARRVGIAKERNRGRQLNPAARTWNWLLYLTVGYGYRSWLAAAWVAGLIVVGSLTFGTAYPAHIHAAHGAVPRFNPILYTLDDLLPVLNLGQAASWVPQGWAAAAWWIIRGIGWPLGTAVLAGLTGALTREK